MFGGRRLDLTTARVKTISAHSGLIEFDQGIDLFEIDGTESMPKFPPFKDRKASDQVDHSPFFRFRADNSLRNGRSQWESQDS